MPAFKKEREHGKQDFSTVGEQACYPTFRGEAGESTFSASEQSNQVLLDDGWETADVWGGVPGARSWRTPLIGTGTEICFQRCCRGVVGKRNPVKPGSHGSGEANSKGDQLLAPLLCLCLDAGRQPTRKRASRAGPAVRLVSGGIPRARRRKHCAPGYGDSVVNRGGQRGLRTVKPDGRLTHS
jgi:hypothetical protein